MKNIIVLAGAVFLLSALNISAQNTESGKVVFEEVSKLEIKLDGEMAHMMKDLPNERRSEKVLYFSPEASLFENVKTEDPETAHMEGGIRIMMSEPDNKLYLDLVERQFIEQREFMTRMFLITGDMSKEDWKITGEQKMILNYPCMEASRTDTAGIVTRAWFAPTIPVQSGPSKYCNLPGLVLEVDIDNGKTQFLAKSIDNTLPDKNILKKPKNGKKVSKDEFDAIVAEKMKEMGEGAVSGGKTVVIKVRH